MPDRFVAVGAANAKIATSDDAINWSQQISSFTNRITAVDYGPAWLAADDGNHIGWSNDGLTWHVSTLSAYINAFAWNGIVWVAVDDFGKIFKSSNGVDWVQQTSGLPGSSGDAELYDVIWDGGQFVAVGEEFITSSGGVVLTSPDGATWTRQTIPSPFSTRSIFAVASNGAGTLVIGASGNTTTKLAYSTNAGVTWTGVTTPFTGTNSVNGISWGDGTFIAVGSAGIMATSPDGITWTSRSTTHSPTAIQDVAYGASLDLWVAVQNSGSMDSSPDGTTWTSRTSSFSSTTIVGIAFGATSAFEPNPVFRADSVIKKTLLPQFTADAELRRAFNANAVLASPALGGSFTASADITLRRFFANAVIYQQSQRSFTAEAILGFDLDFDLTGRNPHDRGERHFGDLPATLVAHSATSSVEQKLRDIWERISSFESNQYKRANFTASAAFRRVVSALTHADAFIVALPHQFTIDAQLKGFISFVADAVVKRNSGQIDFDAKSVIVSIDYIAAAYDAGTGYNFGTYDYPGSYFPADALLRLIAVFDGVGGHPPGISVDALIAGSAGTLYDSLDHYNDGATTYNT